MRRPGITVKRFRVDQLFTKLLSFLLRLGCFNFRNAFASICRTKHYSAASALLGLSNFASRISK